MLRIVKEDTNINIADMLTKIVSGP